MSAFFSHSFIRFIAHFVCSFSFLVIITRNIQFRARTNRNGFVSHAKLYVCENLCSPVLIFFFSGFHFAYSYFWLCGGGSLAHRLNTNFSKRTSQMAKCTEMLTINLSLFANYFLSILPSFGRRSLVRSGGVGAIFIFIWPFFNSHFTFEFDFRAAQNLNWIERECVPCSPVTTCYIWRRAAKNANAPAHQNEITAA